MPKDVSTTITSMIVESEQWTAVRQLALNTGTSASKIVRDALAAYLRKVGKK